MPLRCIDPASSTSVHAFDLSDSEWQELESQNRRLRHFRMPCCAAQVVLRTSPRGTRFFAHMATGECTTAPETEAHLRLKQMAVEAARANGWTAETEVSGTTPSGEQWRADVLAQRDERKAAIEIQWSAQTIEETRRRHARYAAAGVQCLWLIRKGDCPNARALPAADLWESPEHGLMVLGLPAEEFLAAVFSGRMRFGLPVGARGSVAVRVGALQCWSCRRRTNIITGLDVGAGPYEYPFSVPDLDGHAEVVERILCQLRPELRIGEVRRRYSRTQGRPYLSNGCTHCGALIGAMFEHHAWPDQKTVATFPIMVDELWRAITRDHDGYDERWGIFEF